MKNILYIESSSGFGGSGNALVQLLKYLDRSRYCPVVVVFHEGPQFDKLRAMGIEVLYHPFNKSEKPDAFNKGLSYARFLFDFAFKILPLSLRLARLMHQRNIQIVHVNTNILSGLPAIIAAKLAGIPCVCHMRITKRFILREKFFAGLVQKFILLNHEALKLYSRFVSTNRLTVIYDGIDIETYTAEAVSKDFAEEFTLNGHLSVGVIGRLVKGKGQDDFIKAAALLSKKENNIKFFVVGDDPTLEKGQWRQLKNLVKTLGIESDVIFTGWRDDVHNILSHLDIFVHPSSSFPEGLPNSLIEALFLRKPTVATRIAGSSEIVVDRETGLLVEPNDPEALAEAIQFLMEHPQEARKMGEQGQKRAEQLFDIRKNVRQIEGVYEELS